MSGVAVRATVGAACGLAWAAALRAYMAELNTAGSTVTWAGTFAGILLPGVLTGAALGAASGMGETVRQRRALRWCAAAPLTFAVLPMLLPGMLAQLLTTGLGGGAIGVALGGLAGGYAIGGRRRWARTGCGIAAGVIVLGVSTSASMIDPLRHAFATPRGAWVAALAGSLMLVLIVACAIPFRNLNRHRSGAPAGLPYPAASDRYRPDGKRTQGAAGLPILSRRQSRTEEAQE